MSLHRFCLNAWWSKPVIYKSTVLAAKKTSLKYTNHKNYLPWIFTYLQEFNQKNLHRKSKYGIINQGNTKTNITVILFQVEWDWPCSSMWTLSMSRGIDPLSTRSSLEKKSDDIFSYPQLPSSMAPLWKKKRKNNISISAIQCSLKSKASLQD